MSVNEPEKWPNQMWALRHVIEEIRLERDIDKWYLVIMPMMLRVPISKSVGLSFYQMWINRQTEKRKQWYAARGIIDE